jgi:hypothetical protein
MVRSYLAVAGVTVATISFSVLTNCGGSSSTPGAGGATSTSSGAGNGSHMGAEPPALNSKAPTPNGTADTVLAISKLYLGDVDPDGTPDKSNGWKFFGYDLDGQNDTPTTVHHCQPNSMAPFKNISVNGNNGIDNAFGHTILPIILGLSSSASMKINDSIAMGAFTVMLDMEKLGSGTDYQGLTTQLFAGGNLGMTPKWDGTDKWPVAPELLNDGMTIASGSKVQFPMSYVTSNTWVSGGKGNVTLALSVSGFTLSLTISNAQLSLQMAPDHTSGVKGVIAGVLNTDELTSQLQMVAGSFDPTLCSGSVIGSIITQIKQASDIMSDGTQGPAGCTATGTGASACPTCDGISIGLGFEAKAVQLGMVAPAAACKPNPCMDGGGCPIGDAGTD